jgi:hypothetical protein
MNENEPDLIESARFVGQAYIDSFGGDLNAVCADLRRRAEAEGREVISLLSKPPHPWQPKEPAPRRKVS